MDKTISAEEKINSLLRFGVRPGLDRLKNLLNLLGNPQDKLKFVHIAGTNGKGSCSTMIASVLTESGYKTGLFTSPYIVSFRERFRIDGEMISPDELSRLTDYIFPLVKRLEKEGCIITEFEFITALAFLYFEKAGCDVVVLEVGLGGQYDATNVIKNTLVSVICSVSLDHMAVLGDSLEKIASEKAGIIKPGGITVLYPLQDDGVFAVIREKAQALNSRLIIPKLVDFSVLKSESFYKEFEYKGMHYKASFAGEYQLYNTITAIKALEQLMTDFSNISYYTIKKGLSKAKISARLEILQEEPLILLDGAHNIDAFLKLCEFLENNLKDKKLYAIIGIMKDKAVCDMVKTIAPLCEEFFTVRPSNERALDELTLAKLLQECSATATPYKSIREAFIKARLRLDRDSALIICGSLYLAKDIKSITESEV